MQSTVKITLTFLSIIILWSCNSKQKSADPKLEKRVAVEMTTDFGTIILELYNETPKHRDNFIKIARDGVLDSVLFHRVIENFMIQAGDPDSKNAQPGDTLGNGDLDYRVDAEFNTTLFHKKGVLAAARDGNPERASSSTQFYIVQGKVFNDSLLTVAESRINNWLADHYTKKAPEHKNLLDALEKANEDKNMETSKLLNDSLRNIAKTYDNFEHYTIPQDHREVYKTLGGTPHLDQNYSVFGEVVDGIHIVDSIAKVQTGELNRPVKDVRILSVRTVE